MSNPQNPLSQFRSYSAIQVLIMADTPETANILAESNFSFQRDTTDPSQIYNVRNILGRPNNRFVFLYDGRSDTNFYIEDVEWETILAPKYGKPGEQTRTQTIETEGNMKIIEPLGVSFLETMVTSTSNLGVDPNSIVFVLKTIFVGHTLTGEQTVISYVKPFIFKLIDLKADIKSSQSEYSITFFGLANGVTSLPQISNISNGMSLHLQRGMTLSQALQVLFDRINDRYEENFEKLKTESDYEGFEEKFSRVKYTVQTDPEYSSSVFEVGKDVPHDQSITLEDGSKAIQIKIRDQASIETAMKTIFNLCPYLSTDATRPLDLDNDRRYTPKITSTVRPSNDGTYNVEFSVQRFETLFQRPGERFEPQPGEYIEFDYMFTGKNIDIIDLDIKMDMGLSFFYTGLVASNEPKSQGAMEAKLINEPAVVSVKSSIEGSANSAAGTDRILPGRKAPLFLGLDVKNRDVQNTLNPVSAASFDQMLERQARLESVQTNLTIHGNPTILNDLNVTYNELIPGNNTPIDSVSGTGTQNFYKTPSVAKVNIKYPTNKELDAVEDFWYRGFYTILSIKNVFKGGKFTQDLTMFSIPQSDDTDLSSTTTSTRSTTTSRSNVAFTKTPESVVIPNSIPEDLVLDVDYAVKKGVNIENLSPKIAAAIPVVAAVWREVTDPENGPSPTGGRIIPVITSGNDGVRNENSLHNDDLAIDVRGNNVDFDVINHPNGWRMEGMLKSRLGSDFDVLFEVFKDNRPNTHFHIEYDPDPTTQGIVEVEEDSA